MNPSARKGFSVVEIFIVVAVLALGGFLGYKFLGAALGQKQQPTAVTTPAATTSSDTITSSKDLDNVTKQLDAVDVAGSFEQDLDTASSF